MFDLQRLAALREVAALGSFSAAAESLRYTQPAISKQIAALEREVGMPLLERSSGGVRLTNAGELLLEHASAALDRLSLASHQLTELRELRIGRLRLAAFPSSTVRMVPTAIVAFRRQYPGITLSLVEVGSESVLAELRSGEADLAVVTSRRADPDEHEIVFEPLVDDHHLVALPPNHRFAGRAQVSMRELADEPWVEGRHPDCSTKLFAAAGAAGFEPRIAFECDDWMGKFGLVASGVGVALVPSIAITGVRPDLTLVTVADVPPRHLFAASMRRARDNPAVVAMSHALADAGRELSLQATL